MWTLYLKCIIGTRPNLSLSVTPFTNSVFGPRLQSYLSGVFVCYSYTKTYRGTWHMRMHPHSKWPTLVLLVTHTSVWGSTVYRYQTLICTGGYFTGVTRIRSLPLDVWFLHVLLYHALLLDKCLTFFVIWAYGFYKEYKTVCVECFRSSLCLAVIHIQ